MAISGTRFNVFGIDYTTELNTTAAFVWGVIMLLLIYYTWMRRGETSPR
ncbi:hypothetical protein JMG10_10030 [Nostoc ellipsosporum NOK]|nr:hypothetical protein [Nostoc ellipsosporum NOK]